MKRTLLLFFISIFFSVGLKAQLYIQSRDVTCNGLCNGSANVLPLGNYQYLWNNNATTESVSNLCGGIYSCLISDSLGTVLITLYDTIYEPAVLINNLIITDANCGSTNNGQINSLTSGGVAPYFYAWSNGTTTHLAGNLTAGAYFNTVTDANGCSVVSSANVNHLSSPAITASITVTNSTTCTSCDASATATINGGTPPFTYHWSTFFQGQQQLAIYSICLDPCTFYVTDSNGCTASASATVNALGNQITIAATNTAIACYGNSNVTNLTLSGTTSAFLFSWGDGGSTLLPANTSHLSHNYHAPGVYMIRTSDTTGCVAYFPDTVKSYNVNISMQEIRNAACNGINNGKLKVAVSGGIAPYSYIWNTGSITDSILNASPGTYIVTVTDIANCSSSFTQTLGQSAPYWSYYSYISSSNANCGQSNGSISAAVSGGAQSYSYLWNTNPPQTTSTISGLAAGSYSLTITDSAGCQITNNTTIYSGCYEYINGTVFNDINGNCILDSGETPLSGIIITAYLGGNYYYGYTDTNGLYSIQVNTIGTFGLHAGPSNNGECAGLSLCNNVNQTATISFSGDTSFNNNFSYSQIGGNNFEIHPGWNASTPGFQKWYRILYKNLSGVQYNGPATLTIVYDTALIFQYTTPPFTTHNPVTHTITWDVSYVPAQWDWTNAPYAYFQVPSTLPLNYQLQSYFSLTPFAGDCDSSNNFLFSHDNVTGSMDPNEKEVYPAGNIFEDDSVLTYTIHFQNTGNDTTWFVIVKDTLASQLDPGTVVNVASSHKYSDFNISGTGILTWTFNPMFLVDSMTNEPESKAFVSFTVKKKSNLPIGTTIANKASIYFDYNQPVVTNTATNTIADPTGIRETGNANFTVQAYPNPFNTSTKIVVDGLTEKYDFSLFDATGRLTKKITSLDAKHFEIQRNGMAAGVYFFRISTPSKQSAYGKLVVE